MLGQPTTIKLESAQTGKVEGFLSVLVWLYSTLRDDASFGSAPVCGKERSLTTVEIGMRSCMLIFDPLGVMTLR
jgi:hypothetical protein